MPVNQENTDAAWKAFIVKLEENKQHSVVSYFNMATVSPAEENTLEITVQGDFHKKFIDSERSELIVHLQRFFKNRTVTYRFNVLPEPEQDNTQRSLSSKEQYMMLSKQYPWVKALRERLKLEIDL
jgi:DNA polymerase-3 subunit gamma/tau